MSDFDEQIKSLREELLLAQSQRLELAKFKLVSIAVLGSVALGANGIESGQGAVFVIALVPIVALYIDTLGDAKKIQFSVIGAFLREKAHGTLLGEYEAFCEENRQVFYQNYAYRYSTALVSLAITVIGIGHLVLTPHMWLLGVAEVLSGILGFVAAVILSSQTSTRIAQLAASRDRF
jgi:hypothetical protein